MDVAYYFFEQSAAFNSLTVNVFHRFFIFFSFLEGNVQVVCI